MVSLKALKNRKEKGKWRNYIFGNFSGQQPPQAAAQPSETTTNRGGETMGQQLTWLLDHSHVAKSEIPLPTCKICHIPHSLPLPSLFHLSHHIPFNFALFNPPHPYSDHNLPPTYIQNWEKRRGESSAKQRALKFSSTAVLSVRTSLGRPGGQSRPPTVIVHFLIVLSIFWTFILHESCS